MLSALTEPCKRARRKERLTKLGVISDGFLEKAAFVPVFIGRQAVYWQAWGMGEGNKDIPGRGRV